MLNKKRLIYAVMPQLLKVIIAIFITIGIVAIVSKHIATIGSTLNEKKALTIALQQRNETTTTIRNTFATIQDSDKRIINAFPATDNVLDFVAATEALGTQNSMQQSLRFADPRPPFAEIKALTVIPIGYTITTSGTITTLSRYLQQFEVLPYFAGIQSITIATASAKGWEDSSSITLQGTLYTKKPL